MFRPQDTYAFLFHRQNPFVSFSKIYPTTDKMQAGKILVVEAAEFFN